MAASAGLSTCLVLRRSIFSVAASASEGAFFFSSGMRSPSFTESCENSRVLDFVSWQPIDRVGRSARAPPGVFGHDSVT